MRIFATKFLIFLQIGDVIKIIILERKRKKNSFQKGLRKTKTKIGSLKEAPTLETEDLISKRDFSKNHSRQKRQKRKNAGAGFVKQKGTMRMNVLRRTKELLKLFYSKNMKI